MTFVGALAPLLLAASVTSQVAPVEVRITTPRDGAPVFGTIVVSAVVSSRDRVAKVTFFIDDRQTAELVRPPFEATADIGTENVEHRFRVVATTVGGAEAEATVNSPRAEVNQAISVKLQQLYLVARKDGRRLMDLEPTDFTVLDNRERQEIVTFARSNIPFTAAILLDASLSMRGEPLLAAVGGAREFFTAMKPLDEGKLMVFSDRLIHSTPFTNVSEILLSGLERVRAGGGTALNDHLYMALKLLEERQGRRALVVLSDGVDSHSVLSMKHVLAKVHESQALIYWLRLRERSAEPSLGEGRTFSTWHDDHWYAEQARLLRQAVDESGGRIVTVSSPTEIHAAFGEVVHELREQYAIGYYPSNRRGDGSWHRIVVRVARDGAVVATRSGYRDF